MRADSVSRVEGFAVSQALHAGSHALQTLQTLPFAPTANGA